MPAFHTFICGLGLDEWVDAFAIAALGPVTAQFRRAFTVLGAGLWALWRKIGNGGWFFDGFFGGVLACAFQADIIGATDAARACIPRGIKRRVPVGCAWYGRVISGTSSVGCTGTTVDIGAGGFGVRWLGGATICI
jgi:hypothetical protein